MIPALWVTDGVDVQRIEPDSTSLVFAEMAFGANIEEIPEYALRVAIAFYHGPHRQAPGFVEWSRIHAWAMGSRIEVQLAED